MDIKFKDSSGNNITGDVYVTIKIASLLTWTIEYSSINNIFFNYNSAIQQELYQFNVGTTDELNGYSNNWDVILTNPTNSERPFDIEFEWIVKLTDNSKDVKVGNWSRTSSIKPNVGSVILRNTVDFY